MRNALALGLYGLLTLSASAQVVAQPGNPLQQPQQIWQPAPAPGQPPGLTPATDPLAAAPPAAAPSPGANNSVVRSQPGKSLGLEQKAWLEPQKHMSRRQSRPGFVRYAWRPDEIMQINVREGLISVVKFPSNEEIVQVISSDPATFETIVAPNKRSFVMRSIYAGVDGNVIAYGSSGNVYNFYIRSLVFNATTLPDATVEISVGGMANTTGETVVSSAPAVNGSGGGNYRQLFTPAVDRATAHFDAGGREYARGAPLNGNNMRANIIIKAPTPADSAIAPIRAWHDGRFTYLDFGPNASSMVQWPVAALVVQGVESPVGTRVTGRDRSMMVVEAVGNIVLRNGQYIVCLFADFPRNDTRFSVNPPIEDTRTNPVDGRTIRAPAEALSYSEQEELARKREAAAEKRQAAETAAMIRKAEAEARTREAKMKADADRQAAQAAVDARRAEEAQKKVAADAAAKAARDAADREREAKRQEAERQRQEALRPPPAPGRLAATVGPISPSDGSALMRDLERSNGRVVKGLSLQWENDRGAATEPSRIQGRGYLRVGGLDDKLVDALCSTARQRSAGCATVR